MNEIVLGELKGTLPYEYAKEELMKRIENAIEEAKGTDKEDTTLSTWKKQISAKKGAVYEDILVIASIIQDTKKKKEFLDKEALIIITNAIEEERAYPNAQAEFFNLLTEKTKDLNVEDRNKKLDELKEEFNKKGAFYDEVIKIADNINDKTTREEFLSDVPTIIESFKNNNIELTVAKVWLKNELNAIMQQKEEEYSALSEEERKQKIQQYFDKLIEDINNDRGEFYNKILNIVYKMKAEDRDTFLQSIIPTIEEFVKTYLNDANSSIEVEDESEVWGISFGGIIDGILGFLVYPWKRFFFVPGLVANLVLTEIASIGSDTVEFVTIEDILFNNIVLTDINIFDITGSNMPNGKDASGNNASDIIRGIRQEVANWYYSFRNLAIVASLAVLIYIGIKMAISNIAEKRAEYKKMLVNWVVGFGLIFILHYIIIIAVNANSLLVNSLNPGSEMNGTDFMTTLLGWTFEISLTKSWGAIIIYSILEVITFLFLMSYIKRMLMICFLTMIAPLISVSYAIDKSGNNKSEVLNTWFKEFFYNVLIQPFQCIIYIVFAGTAMKALDNIAAFDLATMILAITCILCIFMGERIIRTIFGFQKSKSVMKQVIAGGLVSKAVSNVRKVQKAAEQDEEEPAPPTLMPDGSNIQTVMAAQKLRSTPEDSSGASSTGSSTGTSATSGSSSSTGTSGTSTSSSRYKPKKKTLSKKMPIWMKDVGRAYVRSIVPGAGINTRTRTRKSRKEQKRATEQLFITASEKYRQKVNPAMTNAQLARQMEAIMSTEMTALSNPVDIQYKKFIDHTKDVLTARGRENPLEDMKNMINNK